MIEEVEIIVQAKFEDQEGNQMKKFFIIMGILIASVSAFSQTKMSDSLLKKQRKLFKEYGLCKCLFYGFGKDSLDKQDFSASLIRERLNYPIVAIQKLDAMAKRYTDSIPTSNYIDTKGKKGVILNCLEFYESHHLNEFINGYDSKLE